MKKLLLAVIFIVLSLLTLACVVGAEETNNTQTTPVYAHLETVPDHLRRSSELGKEMYFIVFDHESHFIGSGNTIDNLNTDKIQKELDVLKISLDEIGNDKKYLIKYVFPAYLNDTLVTYVNVNTNIKSSAYFNGKCGYVAFPGTMTQTHDMNERVSALRGVDFGKNSQLKVIPTHFANAAVNLREVKNFPTAKLEVIESKSFDGAKYAFRGELIINARTIGERAFDNATTYVTKLVFGPNVKSFGQQSFSIRSSETGLGNPQLQAVEFKCDVSQLTYTSSSYGAFYFNAGGDSRSEYPSLKCIILSNPNNKALVVDGETLFSNIVLNSARFKFFDDAKKEILYTSHDFDYESLSISYTSFLENGVISTPCKRCGASEHESAAPLFRFDGISSPIDESRIEIYIGFTVNREAIKQYEDITGNKVDFGIVAAAQAVVNNSLPLDLNGNVTTFENGTVIKASANKTGTSDAFELIIKGFTNETDKDISLLLAGYVHITDAENNTVSVNYLQHKQIEGNNFAFVCYNNFN